MDFTEIIAEIFGTTTPALRGNIGSFGEIIFEVYFSGRGEIRLDVLKHIVAEKDNSPDKRVFTFKDFSRKTKARYAKHDLINRQSALEKIGDDVEKITLGIRLVRDLGVEPEIEAEKLRQYCREGRAEFLILGDEVIGGCKFVIVEVDERAQMFDGTGKILVSELSVDFETYEDDENDLQSDAEPD